MDKIITVVNIINHFEVGGAEILLTDFAQQCDDKQIRLILIYLKGEGTLLKNQNIKAEVFDVSYNGKFTPFCFFGILHILFKNNVDILHTHDPQSGILGRIAGFMTGVKCVITTRHNPELIGNHNIVYKIEDWMLSNTDLTIAISEAVKYRIINNGLVNPEKIKVIHNGINLSHFTPKNIDPIDKEKIITIGSVGRLHEQKGFDILLNGFHLLIHNNPSLNITLKIAGDGDQKSNILALIEKLQLQESVTLVGAISDRNKIREFYESIDIFVLASKWEGFGISIVEALAMNKPVIASRVDGIVEIVEDGYNGLLFESQNHIELADKINKVILNSELFDILTHNARTSVEDKFSMVKYAKDVVGVYKDMMANIK